MRNILYVFLLIVLLSPVMASAQYNQNGGNTKGGNIHETTEPSVIAGGAVRTVEIVLSFMVIYIVLIVIIAGIIFVTSGGDENRMDTSITWWKHSIIGLVVIPIIYFIVDKIGDFL